MAQPVKDLAFHCSCSGHCCGTGSILGLGTLLRQGQKKKKERKKKMLSVGQNRAKCCGKKIHDIMRVDNVSYHSYR